MDVNLLVGGLLRDLAAAQASPQKAYGYRRAAACVLTLDESLDTYLEPGNTLRKIRGIGPASTQIILEVLETGTSPTVERAVRESGRMADIEHSRMLRTNFLSRAAACAVLADESHTAIDPRDYRGDLQMHSEWSDGEPSLRELAEACMTRGYAYAAVTDHSHGLAIAGGMSCEQAARQRQHIDEINASLDGRFRLLKGIEANIGNDGQLDIGIEDLSGVEIVLAAPHSRLRGKEDQTERLMTVLSHPHVHVLAHPRGRMMGTRGGIVADWPRVFAMAASENVAIELDGDPARQDLDHALARVALEAGCLFALDSDAHSVAQLRYAEFAIAHARLAGIPPDRVINCWPLDRLLTWISERKKDRTSTPRKKRASQLALEWPHTPTAPDLPMSL